MTSTEPKEVNKKSYEKLPAEDDLSKLPEVKRDRRDGKMKWLVLTLILISSVRNNNKKSKKINRKSFKLKFLQSIIKKNLERNFLLQGYVRNFT